MKTTFKKILPAFFMLAALAFTFPQHSIIGRWLVAIAPDSTKIFVDFNRDGSFKNFTSAGETIFQGKYKINTDTFSINDKNCGVDYWGKYKLTFSGTESISFAVIEDSCSGRKGDIDGSTLKRIIIK